MGSVLKTLYYDPNDLYRSHHQTRVTMTTFTPTGLAVGIHNFPEGLATFVATLSSPSLGIALAVAIAMHNIPEGVCVAMPVYYATGSKWKAFLWAFLSGVSEPVGEFAADQSKEH